MNPPHEWNPESYARNARFVSDLGLPVVEALAPQAGERILDLGCGDGALTVRIVAFGSVVVGVDSSAAQVEAARARGLDARVLDARQLPFDAEFDAVFSNAALHWMGDPVAVLRGVWRALKPGGRFVAECGGRGNCASLIEAFYAALRRRGVNPEPLSPWHFSDATEYRALLERQGFRVRDITLFQRPTPVPGDLAAWFETFAGCFLSALPVTDRAPLIHEVSTVLAGRPRDPEGRWLADYVRLRFAADKAP